MIRATTPRHIFVFDVDPSVSFKTILITYAQNNQIIMEKGINDLTFETDTTGDEIKYLGWYRLTQEETKLFSARPAGRVTVQVRALTYADEAFASRMITIPVDNVLNDEVLT